mmetsp:Transcript_27855/g.46335  ORF Transcript_27855/g.46335 Transcript_27855/m.46335 type:complete len:280 (+) Transcript_27855:301-1140(+)
MPIAINAILSSRSKYFNRHGSHERLVVHLKLRECGPVCGDCFAPRCQLCSHTSGLRSQTKLQLGHLLFRRTPLQLERLSLLHKARLGCSKQFLNCDIGVVLRHDGVRVNSYLELPNTRRMLCEHLLFRLYLQLARGLHLVKLGLEHLQSLFLGYGFSLSSLVSFPQLSLAQLVLLQFILQQFDALGPFLGFERKLLRHQSMHGLNLRSSMCCLALPHRRYCRHLGAAAPQLRCTLLPASQLRRIDRLLLRSQRSRAGRRTPCLCPDWLGFLSALDGAVI